MPTASEPLRQRADGSRSLSGRAGHLARALRVAAGAVAARLRPRRPYNVLRIEISGTLEEVPSERAWSGLAGRGVDLLTLQGALRAAREDEELGLVLLEIHDLDTGWGRIQTLRRALAALRAAGKRVWAYLPQPGMHEYYLASAADRVLLAPAAHFEATGLTSEVVFLKDALDHLGVEAQVARAGRFKSAGEPLTRREMSPEHRAMVEALLDDLYAQILADVAADRRLGEDAVRAAFERGPLLASEALRHGLVDGLAYPDEVAAALEERFGDPAPIDLAAYRRRRAHALRRAALSATPVGLLAVSGPIALGIGRWGWGGGRAGSWRGFRRELGTMARDPRLAAIVLRIDSPGGSGLASDLMWREIVQARRLKPVLVSMADVAASGGYFLAAAADDVTAEGGTLTGSIGVLSVKPVLRGLYERLGVRKELVTRGAVARDSDWVRLDGEQLERLEAEADAFYDDFVGKVAAGRGLGAADVAAAAEGRVWTGRQAFARGLVDRLGGLEQALDELRRRLGLPPDARFAIECRQARRPLWQRALAWSRPFETFGEARDVPVPLDVLAPLAEGERVLAAMPVMLRFAQRGPASLTGELAAGLSRAPGGARLGGLVRLAALATRVLGAARTLFRAPPVVM